MMRRDTRWVGVDVCDSGTRDPRMMPGQKTDHTWLGFHLQKILEDANEPLGAGVDQWFPGSGYQGGEGEEEGFPRGARKLLGQWVCSLP